jgi:transcriptional regulator GlxA family with amidase domain
LARELPVSGEPHARLQAAIEDLRADPIDQPLVVTLGHRSFLYLGQYFDCTDLAAYDSSMQIAILTFDGFNELDSLIALGILGRVRRPDWRVAIASPLSRVRSMNGVVIEAPLSIEDAVKSDAVIVGSGTRTREVAADTALMSRLVFDRSRQLLAAQCSGTLILAKLGLLSGVPACTDLVSKPWVQEAGVEVINQPFTSNGNVATAGGCLASQYLAAWLISRLESTRAAEEALHYVAPVGEKEEHVARAMRNIAPYLPPQRAPHSAAAMGAA